MDIQEIIEDAENMLAEALPLEPFVKVDPSQLWSDHNRIYCDAVWASPECIVVKGQTRTVDYYGGMSYVDADDRKAIGKYSIYLATCNRVRGHLSKIFEELAEDEEDGEL